MGMQMQAFGVWSSCQACEDVKFNRLEFVSCMCGCGLLGLRVHVNKRDSAASRIGTANSEAPKGVFAFL